MGERATGLDGTSVRSGTATAAASPRDQARRLESEISRLREELGELVAELDRRRHELLDVKLQLRRHALEATLTVVTLVGSAAGLVWLRIWRARRRRTILSRAHRLREAAARMIDRPERVAVEPTIPEKIAAAAATAAVATVIRKGLGGILRHALASPRGRPPGRSAG
jgi:hypothetical protein